MAGDRAADKQSKVRELSGSGPSLDAELDRAVGSGEALAYVIVFVGDQPGRVYVLNHNTVLVGRLEDADIHIVDASVSGRHAQIINGSQGFEIEDLESTNGTFIGGQRIRRAPLRNGDRVTVGSVEFIFLVDRPVTATMALRPSVKRALVPMTGALAVPRPAREVPRPNDEEGPSLTEIIRKVVGIYRFIRQRSLLIATLGGAGLALGMASMFALPPGSLAACEVKLVPQAKSNPVGDPWRPPSDDETLMFFRGAERAFNQPDLVRTTLKKVRGTEPTPVEVDSVAARLKLEPFGDHLFRATYRDQPFHSNSPGLLTLLTTHVENYVRSEIDKSLREVNARAQFLRDQMSSVEKDLARINDEKTKFREANAGSLPEDALQTHSSRAQLESRRADLLAQIRRLQGELETQRHQLNEEAPLAQTKFQASQVYRESLADLNRKLSDAYARGLADGHPEVLRLKAEKERIEGLVNSEMRSTTSAVDRRSNPNFQALESRVAMLDGQLRAARSDLSDTEKSLGEIRHVVVDLPRVEQRLEELNHAQEGTTHLHGQLFEKLKQAELQLNLEHVSAESRYEITIPHIERPRRLVAIGTRCTIGLFVGLFMAAAIILFGEGRRLVSEAMASPDSRGRISQS